MIVMWGVGWSWLEMKQKLGEKTEFYFSSKKKKKRKVRSKVAERV